MGVVTYLDQLDCGIGDIVYRWCNLSNRLDSNAMTKIEEVARAIYDLIPDGGYQQRPTTASDQDGNGVYEKVFVPDPWEDVREERKNEIREIAIAAIEAMREPTDKMWLDTQVYRRYDSDSLEEWHAMIDAALDETP